MPGEINPLSFRRTALSVALLSAAALSLEGAMLRLLAVAQFYHFAFLVVSLALLGFGASGSLLSFRAEMKDVDLRQFIQRVSLGFVFSVGLGYAIVNWVPFDSYSIAWERRQIGFFILYYLALTLPFLLAGLGIGAALANSGERSHKIYAANLAGSGLGALLTPLTLWIGGVPSAFLVSGLIGLSAALPGSKRNMRSVSIVFLLIGLLITGFLGIKNMQGKAILGMSISPYKGLSDAKRYPGSTILLSKWNAISRLDVVADAGIRQLPGLSYAYTGSIPEQMGLATDGGPPQAVTVRISEGLIPADFMPEAIAFTLRENSRVLVLESGGGLGILQALAGGATAITVVESNSLVSDVVNRVALDNSPFIDPRVRTVKMPVRPFLRQEQEIYDVIFFPLRDRFRPVTSGAFSLSETYDLTTESFEAALERLSPSGVLISTRWLQIPPSESLRLVATFTEALESKGYSPSEALVVFRGIQTVTVLVQPSGWKPRELEKIREFLTTRKFDLVWAADIQPEEVNRFNRLPTPEYHEEVRALLGASDRNAYYADQPFDIRAPTDDHPFFFHYFRWEQTPEIIASLGVTWQPFGGSGYFVLLALLALVVILSLMLIILPMLFAPRQRRPETTGSPQKDRGRVLLYFSALGIAFLFVEIPLIQRWILYLGHATYAFMTVVVIMLVFSSLGSLASRSERLPRRAVIFGLVTLVLLAAFVLPTVMEVALGWPVLARVLLTILVLAPLGFLMGLPFPWGLAWLQVRAPELIPWAWAVNGCASVIAAVVAAIISLGSGFTLVIALGGLAYAVALSILPARNSYMP